MAKSIETEQSKLFSAPFDATARGYDAEFTDSSTGQMQRAIVHACLKTLVFSRAKPGTPNSKTPKNQKPFFILELNCGTGQDACWLAEQGCQVLATDISEEMVAVAREKAQSAGFSGQIEASATPIQDIRLFFANRNQLPDGKLRTQFDLVFSNFGGFNCLSPDAIEHFGTDLLALLRPGGFFVAVVMGRFCWQESLYFLLKGRGRTAFRRFSTNPVAARLNATTHVPTWYFAPGEFANLLKKNELSPLSDSILIIKAVQPVGFCLPPSYLDPLFRRWPLVLKALFWLEKKCRARFFAHFADHYLICFQKIQKD